ncbi:hypothetical protein ACIHAA_06750 [Streptomyces sp. NPDC052040]|uniref:hypothetical protein n=1 Tax=Streptomyces sp. NPDC052040 TaxID=3365682 RepID=UPI0037D44E71
MAPSRIVDEGWHALILHTAMYAELCERLGSFVHHYPGYDPTHYDPPVLDRTREKITALGWEAAHAEARVALASPVKGGCMSEWIDPRYAQLVAAWKRTQQQDSRDPHNERPVRGFIVPQKG